MKKIVKLIVAHDKTGIIGHGLDMPGWVMTDDLQDFSQKTKGEIVPVEGNPVIIGHNTALSILKILGQPYPKRKTIVVSSRGDPLLEKAGFVVTKGENAFADALVIANDSPGEELWIAGGGKIYAMAFALHIVDEIHRTIVLGTFPAKNPNDQIFFPEFDITMFRKDRTRSKTFTQRQPKTNGEKDRGNSHNAEVSVYVRRVF
mgnify:FL=1